MIIIRMCACACYLGNSASVVRRTCALCYDSEQIGEVEEHLYHRSGKKYEKEK